ncbi:MAG: hypothetical protein NC099_00840 [Corallococcus sp.]|nr:hypothetical protein [Bacillota bacterium]MCM1533180.1 hypothetical protein [Corallococcus sp.]
MNKKLICLLLVLLLALVCLSACEQNDAVRLTEINRLLRLDYSEIEIEVLTEIENNVQLEGKYKVTRLSNGDTKVEYKYESINDFEIENGVITAPDEFKSVYTGTAIVRNGVVAEHNGAEISDGDITKYATFSLTLRNSCFRKTNVNTNRFQAFVANGKEKELFGEDFDGNDARIAVEFTDKAITMMEITYYRSGAKVTAYYVFTK